ncbi:MAG: hypothetical protein JOZ08_26290 [Verrucomicrobia bacterium]|nr:hypothetical protein [Verrucomicrobiota bacterium]MBV8274301.1 hypothetical protein [Verrucomicrobiota bacterium]
MNDSRCLLYSRSIGLKLRKLLFLVATFFLTVCYSTLLFGESPSMTPPQAPQFDLNSHPDWPKANPEDVATIESTVRAFFDAISAPAGGKLDRVRLRSLFVPAGRIVSSRAPSSSQAADLKFLSPDEYAALSDSQTVSKGFFDRNLANEIERFGVMAHVYSAYESRFNRDDAKPVARGIKSFELLNSGNRWYIVQMYWDSERPDNPIPDRYLHDNVED